MKKFIVLFLLLGSLSYSEGTYEPSDGLKELLGGVKAESETAKEEDPVLYIKKEEEAEGERREAFLKVFEGKRPDEGIQEIMDRIKKD